MAGFGNCAVIVILVSFGIAETIGAFNVLQYRYRETPFSEFYWGLTNSNNTETCILLSGLFEIAVPYDTDYFSTAIAKIIIPRNASVDGVCNDDTNQNVQILVLTWSPVPGTVDENKIKHNVTFVFLRNVYSSDDNSDSDAYYQLSTIQATIRTNDEEFPDAADTDKVYEMTASNLGVMSAPESLSYYCKSTQIIEMDDGDNSISFTLVHAEAFHDSLALGDGNDFGPRSFCAKDGFEIILMVLMYVIVLALIGLAVFYIVDKRSKRSSYIYL